MVPEHVNYKIVQQFDPPRMFRARQNFPRDRIGDIEGAVRKELDALALPDLSGKRIALTGGSRGVDNQARILKAVADCLKAKNAVPFIVPGMGSHGGATAEGQREFLAGYGITEETMGVPILATMDVTQLGTTASGFPVFCDRNAAEADYILPVHRIKAHTAFKAEMESGPSKMMVIGLGKHEGATRIHALGFEVFPTLIPEAAQIFIDTGKVLAAVGIVENAYDQTMIIEGIPTARLFEREKALLAVSKDVMARLRLDYVDVLVIEELGKDISGGGMDSNITGRPASGLMDGFDVPCPINKIAVLGISELSHGNAVGMGLADVITLEFARQIDFGATYINCITSRMATSAKMPMVANHDLDAVRLATIFCLGLDPAKARICQIISTLHLSELCLSENYLDLVRNDKNIEILSEPEPMRFDANNRLERLPRH